MALIIIAATAITVLVLALGALTTDIDSWYRDLRKPAWNPPNWVFGPAWTIILGLAAWAGVAAWLHARDDGDRLRVGLLFAVNIALYSLWTPLFFNLRRPDWALVEVPFLWLSILALVIGLVPMAPVAGVLLLPYLLWVTFAALLNLVIVQLNGPFERRA